MDGTGGSGPGSIHMLKTRPSKETKLPKTATRSSNGLAMLCDTLHIIEPIPFGELAKKKGACDWAKEGA